MHIFYLLTFRSFLLSLLLGLFFIPYSHATNNVFVKYSKSEGLVQNTVTNSLEDANGFMWFSTFEGLSRFDGYEFKNYRHTKKEPDSLPNNFTKKLLLDSSDNLWVATQNGLAKYNPLKDNFTNYNKDNSQLNSNDIFAIALNKDGNLLVSTAANLYLYDNLANSFLPFTVNGESLPADIKVIFSESDKTWLGSLANGIFILEHSSNTLFSLKKTNPWNLKIDSNFIYDFKKIDGNYWLGTEDGAYKVDANLSSETLFNTQSAPSIIGNEVRSILQNYNGNIWLGTTTGISILNQESKILFSYDAQNNINFGLESSHILSLFIDSNNSIWLGTYSGGLYRYNSDNSKIKLFNKAPTVDEVHVKSGLSGDIVWGLAEDSSGKIWVATQSNGLNQLDSENYVFKQFLDGFEHNIWALRIDKFNQIWVASSGGIFVYQQSSDTELTLIKNILLGKDVLKLSYFFGRMWLRSENGTISWIDPKSLEVNTIDLADNKIYYIEPLFVDADKNLWLNTNLGMVLYNLDNKMLRQLVIELETSVRHFNSVIEVDDGYWLSSLRQGIIKLEKSTYKITKQLNDENGLASNQILKTIKFKESLWASHVNGGIDEISLETGELLQNIASSRLGYNELNEDSGLLTKAGMILFGGSDGLLMFDPDKVSIAGMQSLSNLAAGKLSIDPKKQQLYENPIQKSKTPTITQIRLFNLPISVHSDNSPLSKPINFLNSIALPHESTMLSIKFAQLNPVNPEAVKYRYRMLGLSEQWIETDVESLRRAQFSYLEFGSYEFVVQSKDPLAPWSDSKSLQINIAPPFWLEQNARISYAILSILTLLYWFKQVRSRNAIRRSILENEERLKLTLWSSGDELWDWDIYQGQVFRSNTWGTLDFPQDDIRVNSSCEANIHPNDIQRVQQSLNEHLSEKTEHYETTYRAKTYKGDWLWVLDRGKVVARDNNHQPQRMTGTLKNISHLKEAEEQLKLFKRSIETISDGVFITDTSFKFISVNNSYCKYTGETREQALASYLTFHQYPGAFTEEVKKSLRQKGNWSGEVESRRGAGEKYEMDLNVDAITDEDGKISHYVGVFSDITSRKVTEKELLKLSNTDPLTDLPNRSFFQASHSNIVRRDTHHALICMDMDNFKKINDSLGHQTGDVLIKQIAKRLQKMAGTKATCYRLGGDEFSILIDNSTDIHHITHFAQTILDNMSRPFIINKQEFVLGASLGIAFYPEDGRNPQELLKNADTAMYFAKNAGGNKYQFFSGEMNQNAVRQLQIENLIRHGLKEDLFRVFYQPKVDIASGKLVSMEALVRYEHPEKGIVSPAQFIPLAEQTGQIIEIGEVVLRKACEDTKRWVDAGLFTGRVAVNIAARQFEIPDLDERIMSILQNAGLSALHLECEITESTLMQSPENALRMMQRLRERGIHLALDDFGTGFSSLAYLKRFPINTLKIDKAFIDDIATSAEDRHMAQAIITIAHNLGLKVVAEGVEHENQLSILRRYKCEMLQGYLYSKPLNAVRFERLLKENHELRKIIQNSSI